MSTPAIPLQAGETVNPVTGQLGFMTPFGFMPAQSPVASTAAGIPTPFGAIPVQPAAPPDVTPFGTMKNTALPVPPAGPGVPSPFGMLGGGPGSATAAFLQALALLEQQFGLVPPTPPVNPAP